MLRIPVLPDDFICASIALAAAGVCALAKWQIGEFIGDVLDATLVLEEAVGICALTSHFHS